MNVITEVLAVIVVVLATYITLDYERQAREKAYAVTVAQMETTATRWADKINEETIQRLGEQCGK